MGILEDAAFAWEELYNKRYSFAIGKAGKLKEFCLTFDKHDFYHLAGFQYLTDIDLGVSKKEMFNGKLIEVIKNGRVSTESIACSDSFEKVSGRLAGIVEIEKALDDALVIFKFDPRRVQHGTTINAKYLIKSENSSSAYFVFFDKDYDRWFCRSVFPFEKVDFSVRQEKYIILKKMKYSEDDIVLSYISPRFRQP